nr:fimbrial biogenesis outer membrane usher protein [Neisseriaceae bacterium]
MTRDWMTYLPALSLALASAMAWPQAVSGAEEGPKPEAKRAKAQFDETLLRLSSVYPMVDLSQFAQADAVLPGRYLLDVYVNNQWQKNALVTFQQEGDHSVALCLDDQFLLGIRVLAPLKLASAVACPSVGQRLPGASYDLNLPSLRLNMVVPQALLNDSSAQAVPAHLWDKGHYAAYLDYNANSYATWPDVGQRQIDHAIGVRAGIHFGRWAIRHSGYYSKPERQSGHYQSNDVYLQTDSAAWRSQLKIGDFYGYSQFVEGVKLRGIELKTDERMQPARWRGYAPVVRGVAMTHAKVTIRQQQRVIYESTVPPGAFAIKDLSPLGYAGDLKVTVTEADGREVSFTVPFSSVAQLIRPGAIYYSAAVGRLHDGDHVTDDMVWQGSVQYGLSNYLTVNTAAQLHPEFQLGQVGAAINTRIGALGIDWRQTKADMGLGRHEQGRQLKLNYHKFVASTDTNINLTAYRYSATGFRNLDAYLRAHTAGNAPPRDGQPKQEVQLTLNQTLPEGWGSVYVSGLLRESWHRVGRDRELQFGYSNGYRRLNYGVSFNQVEDVYSGRKQNRLLLTFSLPFDVMTRPQYLNVNHNRGQEDGGYTQVGLSGALDQGNRWSYQVSASQQKADYSLSAGTYYRSGKGNVSASVTHSQQGQQASLGASGAVVLHPLGLSLSENLGDAFAIVYAEG